MGELRTRQLRRFSVTQSRLARLHVPRGVSDRLAPLIIGRDVRIEGDTAHFPAGGFKLSAPRRFLRHHLASPYEPQLTGWLDQHLPLGGTAIDVGAHIGYLTMVMADRVGPSGHVYAVEPALENVEYLARNVSENDFHNIDILAVAIADKPGLATFNLNESSDSFGFFEHPNTATVATRSVPVMSLDALFSDARLPRLDLIKVDVEGAEPEAISGMAETLGRFPGAALAVEWFPAVYKSRGIDPMCVPGQLTALGYDLAILDASDGSPTAVHAVGEAIERGLLPSSWYCSLVAESRS